MGDFEPNTFATPNILIDSLMSELAPSEFKVLMFTYRHVYGFAKREDKRWRISLSMYEGGYTSKEGYKFGGTGLTRPTIIKALNGLVEKDLLIVEDEADEHGRLWGVNLKPSKEILPLGGKESLLGSGKEILPLGGKESLPKQLTDNQLTDNQHMSSADDTQENSIESSSESSQLDDMQKSAHPDNSDNESEADSSDESDNPTNEPLTLPADKSQALTDTEIRTWAIMNVWDIAKPTTRNLNAKSREKRLEVWSKAVRKIHKDNGTQCTESHLDAFKSWWDEKYKGGASLPRKKDSIEDHYETFYLEKKNGTYRAQQQAQKTTQSRTPALENMVLSEPADKERAKLLGLETIDLEDFEHETQ